MYVYKNMVRQVKPSNGKSLKYKLIVGLGNPGHDYEGTYHNAGSLFIENSYPKVRFKTVKNFAYAKKGNMAIVKPLTFMNESGRAVAAAIKYFKIKPAETVIVHDDSDIEIGKYKLSFGRGSAGHNGVESVIRELKTKEFSRLRLGVGKETANKKIKAGEFVLRKIGERDYQFLESAFREGLKAITI